MSIIVDASRRFGSMTCRYLESLWVWRSVLHKFYSFNDHNAIHWCTLRVRCAHGSRQVSAIESQDCSRSRVNYLSSRISHDATSYPASTSDNYLARYDTYCREFDLKHHFYCMFQTSDHFFSEEPVLSIRLPSWQLGWWGRPRGRFS